MVVRRALNIVPPLAEVVIIIALAIGASAGYHAFTDQPVGVLADYAVVGTLISLLVVLPKLFENRDELISSTPVPEAILRLAYVWNLGFFCFLVAAFLLKISDNYSRGALLTFYLTGLPALAALRLSYARWLKRRFRSGALAVRHGLLIGTERRIRDFRERYRPSDYGFYMTEVVLPPESSGKDRKTTLAQSLGEAVAATRNMDVDDIFLLVPWSDAEAIETSVDALMTVPASIYIGPEEIFDRFRKVRVLKVGRSNNLNLIRPPLDLLQVMTKRVFDLCVASLALIFFAPLLVLIAVLIKLDSPGPVFFLQRRHGFNQKPFRIVKFRTMTTSDDGSVVPQVTPDDPRLTRVGRFLRRWNFDELPQLVNVIIGQMSVVGPRPHALTHDRQFERKIALYARRHNVKPGITGWAQVNGFRGITDTDEKMHSRVQFDLYYIDNWSIWFDLYILAMTVFSPKAFRNAH